MRIVSLFLLVFISLNIAFANKYVAKKTTDKNGREYTYYTNDPVGVRIYEFDNGLKLYVSVNKDEPIISTNIAVKAGSTYDPSETTGLAHYLEHMMFKGTSKFGTVNWEKEKPLLDTISALYERHKATSDTAEKANIYRQIDSVSQLASKYVVSNEFDQMTRSLGADGTNAYTWLEETVYINKIPSGALRNYLILESERFNELVLRLFHTEIEAVYEEFNMSQDKDSRKSRYALMRGLFPNHPYGTQTTIGTAEHLKNPSMENIHAYWNKYYVPNNMALCLTGDLDQAQTAHWVDSIWGSKVAKSVEALELKKEEPQTEPVVIDVYGPNPENLLLGYRTDGVGSEEELYVSLIDYMLCAGGTAGLIDLNLVKSQKVLAAGCTPYFMKDHGVHMFYGVPREGQSLEEVRDLLFAEIEKVKNGDFDEWLLDAVINDMKLHRIKAQEQNGIAGEFVSAFTLDYSWDHYLSFPEKLEAISKESVMEFAKKFYTDNNYVVVNKRVGEDSTIVKMDKPAITPIEINRDDQSEFLKSFSQLPIDKVDPVFINYDSLLVSKALHKDIPFNYIQNVNNGLFGMYYIIEMGKFHNLKFPLAVNYLEYLGTNKYSSDALAKELFKHGLSFGVSAGNERSYVYISGLDQSLEKALELLEHILMTAEENEIAYSNYVEDILKQRANAKIDKRTINNRLLNYGRYGKASPSHDFLSEEELKSINPKELVALIKEMMHYKHQVFYYGPRKVDEVLPIVKKYHSVKKLKDLPEPRKYTPLETKENTVLFVNYDMVQASIFLLNRGEKFDKSLLPYASLYNEYFGAGMSSIVFQEIRESKALAYSAYSVYRQPSKVDDYSFTYAFVGTGADKLEDAVTAMNGLLKKMPQEQEMFDGAKQAILDRIATDRIIKSGIYFSYLKNKDRGISHDVRKDIYDAVGSISIEEMALFFENNISQKPYTYLVMGNKEDLDMEVLKRFGTVTELTIEDLFGY